MDLPDCEPVMLTSPICLRNEAGIAAILFHRDAPLYGISINLYTVITQKKRFQNQQDFPLKDLSAYSFIGSIPPWVEHNALSFDPFLHHYIIIHL
jgi:hypothetical protein